MKLRRQLRISDRSFAILKKLLLKTLENQIGKIDPKNLNQLQFLLGIRARLNYHFSLCFRDEFIEATLSTKIEEYHQRSGTSVQGRKIRYKYGMFDSYGWDARGLTEQYIRALIDNKYEFIYIFDGSTIGDNILSILHEHGIEILDLSQVTWLPDKIDIMAHYHIERMLIHKKPESILPFIARKSLNIRETYLINLTDHEYWAGIDQVDHFLEFREYGQFITLKGRKPRSKNTSILPYYPILPSNDSHIHTDLKIDEIGMYFFSAGNIDKTIDNDLTFLQLVIKILEMHATIKFVFAYFGSARFMQDRLPERYKNRVIFLGVVDNIDIYIKNSLFVLNTYPIGGGLVGSYAVENRIPFFSLIDPQSKHTHPSNTFKSFSIIQQSHEMSVLLRTINKFINQDLLLFEDLKKAKAAMTNQKIFADLLLEVFEKSIEPIEKQWSFDIKDISANQHQVSKMINKRRKSFAKRVMVGFYQNKQYVNYQSLIVLVLSLLLSISY